MTSMFELHGIKRADFVEKYGQQAAQDFEEYGVMPNELEKAAAKKGWRFRLVRVRIWPGGRREFHFESIEVRQGWRCLRGVWAETPEAAIAQLEKPRW